ncbi:MAG: flagellar biosynthetic protein FliR [Candidatus Eremiobacteraeota bacterium]|nr:flagellar biosynthetic protein FliR [Candidatus Eremiobacteraeota bacterium]
MDTGLVLVAMFLLTFTRIVTMFVQAPIWGSHHMPTQVLIGAAGCMAFIILPQLPIPQELYHITLPGFGLMVMGQALIGLVIGFVSFIILAGAQFAGEMLDIQMGLSVAAAFDPASHGAINLLRRFKFYFAMIIYLIIGGHRQLIYVLAKSFELIPLTRLNFPGGLIELCINLVGTLFYLAVQIAAPVLAALFIVQVALGLLSRVAPQMNVFMLSFPLNIAIGVMLLTISLPIFAYALHGLFDHNYHDLIKAVQYMSPGR